MRAVSACPFMGRRKRNFLSNPFAFSAIQVVALLHFVNSLLYLCASQQRVFWNLDLHASTQLLCS